VFQAGHEKVGGRKKGTPNRATVAWKTFVTELCEDREVQKATRDSIVVKGKTELVFKAAEHAHGKPKETYEVNAVLKMINWPDGEDVGE
jgi:hypothetical protein